LKKEDMESFTFETIENGEINIFKLKGYFTGDSGIVLTQKVDELLKSGKIFIVLDFLDCSSVNSLGAASLLDLALKVIDVFRGRFILTGLNQLKVSFFSMAGIIPVAEVASTIEEACKSIREKELK